MRHAFLCIWLAAVTSLTFAPPCAPAQAVAVPATPPPSGSAPHDASLDDYRAHLQSLTALVQACAKARDVKTCDPTAVGPDDQVPAPAQPAAPRRLIRYGWLRVLLSKAQDKDVVVPAKPKSASTPDQEAWENVRPLPPTTSQLLQSAQKRLAADLAQASAPPAPLPDHAQQRATLKQVLAQRDFAGLEETSPKETAFEKVGNWLNRIIESAIKASGHAAWLGRALVWGFILAVCIGLIWGLLQLERRWRVRLVPEDHTPAPGAASAIPWQWWMEDARRAAQSGLWREAIHFLYWASISRLESKRLWPADRARTPREYLALVAGDDPRHDGLASLTGSFERVWYGGRPAVESDYEKAEQIASALISGGGTSGGDAG